MTHCSYGLYGPITVARERLLRSNGVNIRVFVGDEDVTRRCYYVDDTPDRAVALLYRHNERGHCYVDADGSIATEVVGADIHVRREILEP